jgi:hypothetical protein
MRETKLARWGIDRLQGRYGFLALGVTATFNLTKGPMVELFASFYQEKVNVRQASQRRLMPRRVLWASLTGSVMITIAIGTQPALANEYSLNHSQPISFERGLASFALPGAGQWLNQDHPKDSVHLALGISLVLVPLGMIWLFPYRDQRGQDDPYRSALYYSLGLTNLAFHTYSAIDAFQRSEGTRPQGTVW